VSQVHRVPPLTHERSGVPFGIDPFRCWRTTLLEFLLKRPAEGEEIPDDFDIERSREPVREIDLFD